MPSKNFIVAIELGSTKITGVAGQKNHDGSFTVNAVVREDSTTCIRKGVVYNADKTVQCITTIINRLKTSMKTEIAQVYVGVGGQSIHSVRNVLVKDLADSQQAGEACYPRYRRFSWSTHRKRLYRWWYREIRQC